MRKILTLFRRDPDDMRRVLPEVTPGCEWVLAGEGVPTRKLDGTCVMYAERGFWWARREVKPGKQAPVDFVPVAFDETTGKRVGWVPMESSAFAKWHAEAAKHPEGRDADWLPGTYELIGPKINGNPEGAEGHELHRHGVISLDDAPRTLEGLREYLLAHEFEGIVWHHEDGRMAKLKRRDFA